MSKVKKHSFEAVSLLTVDKGFLEITIVPAVGQPDWLIPTSLILSVDTYDEHVWTYLWRNQEVAVYHLLPKEVAPNKIIVLEGNTEVHRLGLQTKGDLHEIKVRISEVKDVPVPDEYLILEDSNGSKHNEDKAQKPNTEAPTLVDERLRQVNTDADSSYYSQEILQNILPYLFQTVSIDETIYTVPDLDKLAHHLVDLDS